jgi:hypothetical protein
MPYIPPTVLEDTTFPIGMGADLATQILLILEKWSRFYPIVDYYMVNKAVVPIDHTAPVVTSPDGKNLITGEAGTTTFDTLYRENVPTPQLATGWQQPQSATGQHAGDEEKWKIAHPVHARFKYEATQTELKRYGFDKLKDVLIVIPTRALDLEGMVCKEGDKVIHGGRTYLVVGANVSGYWKNTNIPLFMGLNCEDKRVGA